MIVLPALSGLAAPIQLILEGAVLGALFGAFFGGAVSGGGEAVAVLQEHGEVNQAVIQDVAESAAHGAVGGAVSGAVGGAVTGGVFGLAGATSHPVLAMIDDFIRSIFGWLDDAVRSVAGTADDLANSVVGAADDAITGIKNAAKSIVNGIRAWLNHTRNVGNAANFRNLPKTFSRGNEGYVYVMKDAAKSGRFKIGKTTQPVERLRALQSKTGRKLDYTCIIKTDDMKSLENKLFEEFDRQRRRNLVPGTTEMFLLNAAEVASACSR